MSGHSRWSTIKRKKGAADQKRGREFSKLIRVLTAAARQGGGDVNQNIRLRTAVDKAKSINMPTDTIQRAISRGSGEGEGVTLIDLTYEGYGPNGVALIVEAITENRNRTTAEVRHILSKYGGSLGESGCVMWMFNKKGVILVDKTGVDEDALMEVAIENGADEVNEDGGMFAITCAPAEFEELKRALAAANFKAESAELSMEPQTTVELDEKAAESLLKLMNALEDNEDVQNVYSNFNIPDELMEKLAS